MNTFTTKSITRTSLICALTLGLGACGAADDETVDTIQQGLTANYVITCKSALPANFPATIAANGDTLVHFVPDGGFAVVATGSPNTYKSTSCDVELDIAVQWVTPHQNVALEAANPPNSGDDDFFFDLQWGHDAVNAPEAWNAGVRGSGARVAVLDTGFDLTHPDLAPNINFALSRDFTGQGLAYTLPDPFSHGTHTAGTIAAADNAFGAVGVAPDAELVLVKVLHDEGYGSFGDVIAGMYYATNVGADIISMSLGALFPRSADTGPGKLTVAMNRAASYARKNGSLVIAAAGNDAVDFDHTADWIHLPSDSPGVLSISATAPRGWATPAGSNLDYLASYSNYGRSAISFAAPGGDFVYPGNESCVVAGLTRPCWIFDLVFSTGNRGWYWSAGTSMAAPHAAGVAALIVSEGVKKNPAALEKAIRARAEDLGQPGNDPAYGGGRVRSGY